MKKAVALVLVLAMFFSLCACSSANKDTTEVKNETEETNQPLFIDPKQEAFEISKEAYENINVALEIVEKYSTDVYEAWRVAIYEENEVWNNPCVYLDSKLALTEAEIREGAAYCNLCTLTGDKWEDIPEEYKEKNRKYADSFFLLASQDYEMFTICTQVVADAYAISGKTNEAKSALDAAKMLIKQLSEEYSDYEHYENIKGLYTTTVSLLDFCLTRNGSFEQAKITINDYRNEIRDYQSELGFIFDD